MVDLGQMHDIDAILLHNRDDCCGERLRDVTVEILAGDGTTIAFASPLLNENNGKQGPAMLAVGLPELTGDVVRGRYVRVRRAALPGESSDTVALATRNVLSLGEVQVFATPAPDAAATQGKSTNPAR